MNAITSQLTRNKLFPCGWAFLAALLTAVMPSSLPRARSANPPKTDPTQPESRSQGYDLEINEGVILRGGARPGKATASLANVIDAVRERYPEANIVLAPGLANLTISDLKLRTGSIWEELEAIRVASGGKFEWSGPNSPIFGRPGSPSPNMFGTAPGPVDPTTGLPTAGGGSNNRGLFTLHEPWPTPETERVVEAFNIGGYLQSVAHGEDPEAQPANWKESQDAQARRAQESLAQIKEIIIQTIAALHPDHVSDSPRFQFHQGATLLVVIGSRSEVEVARKVINALPGQANMAFARPGNGLPDTGMNSAEREAFMRRYGLVHPPNPSPKDDQEQFRRRYGLPPNQSAPKEEPDPKPQP